jgi:serine/threonine-protein kinase
MANKDSDDDGHYQSDGEGDSDELELGRIDPLAGEYSELDDALLVAKVLGEPPPSPPRLAGRWGLLERLGSGGMGEVRAAYDWKLERMVAIKFLHLRHGQVAEVARKRLEGEAQAMARIRRPAHVVEVYDVGAEGERVYLVMEYIKGPTLAGWRQQAERTCDEILAVYLQAGQGLAAIHAVGLIHRDFKPANAFVTAGEAGGIHVAVGDLGLAFATEPSAERPAGGDTESALHPARPLTATGAQPGTIQYMAPEQLRGEQADADSDQFAFCVSLYEALCGQRPFHEAGSAPAQLLASMERGMPAARQTNGKPLPAHVERALRRGLSMDRAARFPDMRTLLAALAPRPRRMWPWVTAGVMAPALVIALLLLRGGAPPTPCKTEAARELDGIWDEDVQTRLRERIAPNVGTSLGRAWATLDRLLHDQSAGWQSARAEVCEEERAATSNRPPDRTLTLRRECLRKNRRTLAQVSQAWLARGSDVGPNPVARLYGDAQALHKLRACSADNVALMASSRSEVSAPADPARQEKLTSLGDKLADIESLEREGKYEVAEVRARETLTAAEGLNNEPLLAEAKFRLGHVLTYLEKHEEAAPLLESATVLAAIHDMKTLAVDFWLYRLKHAIVALADTNLAHRWTEVTKYFLLQTGDFGRDNIWRAEYEEALGLLASREARHEDAAKHHEEALRIRRDITGPGGADLDAIQLSKSLNNLANVKRVAKEYDQAIQLYEKALGLREQVFGRDHLLVGEVLFNLGVAMADRGDHARATDYLDRALRIEDALPERTGAVLNRLLAMGVTELQAHEQEQKAGREERAREHLDRAQRHATAIAELHGRLEKGKAREMKAPRRIHEHVFLARVYELRQDHQMALDQIEAALHLHDRERAATTCGDGHDAYRDDLVSAASLLCEVGRAPEARAYIEKALNPPVSCRPDITDEITKRVQEEITRPACRP